MADILYTYIRTHVCARTQPHAYKKFWKTPKSTILGHGLVNQHFSLTQNKAPKFILGHGLVNQHFSLTQNKAPKFILGHGLVNQHFSFSGRFFC